MNHKLNRIRRLYSVIDNSVFMVSGNLDYHRVTDGITRLADAIADYDGDSDDWLYIGECRHCALSDFIVGAYWHYTEWHGGQWSDSYRALCALGRVFQPGMTSIESERADGSPSVEAFDALEVMASSGCFASPWVA